MKHKHYWCPYDPVKKEWWFYWIKETRKVLERQLADEKEFYQPLEPGRSELKRLKIKKIRLVEVRK